MRPFWSVTGAWEHPHPSMHALGESRLTSIGSRDKPHFHIHSPLINDLWILQHTINPAIKGRMEYPWQRSLSKCWGCRMSLWAVTPITGVWLLQTRPPYHLPQKLQVTLKQLKQHILELTATKKKLLLKKIPPCATCPRSCKSCALSIPEWLDWKRT